MRRLTRKRLCTILSRFNKCAIPVIGDVILDEHIWGHVPRISPEAPVPSPLPGHQEDDGCGGHAPNSPVQARARGRL